MPVFIDQTNRSIHLSHFPKRIISLVPSQTELLYDLGLDEEVIGITKFCVHPQHWFRNKTRIGGTKQLNVNLIRELNPDLIIANKEENEKQQIELLADDFPVWISDITNLYTAYAMMEQIGALVNKKKQALELVESIKIKFDDFHLQQELIDKNKLQYSCIYLIWRDPYMTVGNDTFIHALLETMGLFNLMQDKSRYPVVSIADLTDLQPAILLLSSEPFPFKQKHCDELQLLLPATKIILVDGELFSWYGSRLQHSPAYFKKLLKQLK